MIVIRHQSLESNLLRLKKDKLSLKFLDCALLTVVLLRSKLKK
jgi:hypothetical protein